jgi:uncharacterized membrane protein YecN with MAPEG domain
VHYKVLVLERSALVRMAPWYVCCVETHTAVWQRDDGHDPGPCQGVVPVGLFGLRPRCDMVGASERRDHVQARTLSIGHFLIVLVLLTVMQLNDHTIWTIHAQVSAFFIGRLRKPDYPESAQAGVGHRGVGPGRAWVRHWPRLTMLATAVAYPYAGNQSGHKFSRRSSAC